MTFILDGMIRVYTRCTVCKGLMQVAEPDMRTHPCCEPEASTMDGLVAQWLSAALAEDTATERAVAEQIEAIDNYPPNLRAAAVRYGRMGWPVFPLSAHSKIPIKGSHGFKDATTDLTRIERWWTKHPMDNIGLATGHAFDVIDVDVKKQAGGVNSFLDLLQRGAVYDRNGIVVGNKAIPDVHGIAVTATGGMHFYIEPTGEGNAANNIEDSRTDVQFPGIDFRGLGGFVVAPPSTLGTRGKSYTWMVTPSTRIRKD